VPYEAFLAEKPVVTTTDAGGPLEVVADRATGIVCEPRPEALAAACAWLRSTSTMRERSAGRESAWPTRCRGTPRSIVCFGESRLLLAPAAGPLRHRGLLGAPATPAFRPS